MKRLFGGITALLILLLAVAVVRALTLRSDDAAVPAAASDQFDEQALAERLSAAVKIQTISHQNPGPEDAATFSAMVKLLEANYPKVFQQLQVEIVNEGSLLIHWTGSDPSLKPMLLLNHLDVVPVSPGTEDDWLHGAFGGEILDGYIWGRGTLDDKSGVLGLLEAAEYLLGQSFKPQRGVYFAFGHDEEIGGRLGAQTIAARLKERGVEAEFVLDEGGVVTKGMVDGVTPPVAMIGIAEKGYLSVKLAVSVPGGHSSTPPRATAIGKLTRAVAAIEASPMRPRIDGAVEGTLLALAPHMDFGRRLAMANLWLFRPLVLRLISGSDTGRASVQTTIAPTIFQSGDKDNVLPAKATAVINLRLLPGDSIEAALAHLQRAADDPDVTIQAMPGALASSAVSDPRAAAFKVLQTSIKQALPDVLTSPYLTIGGTDATHYAAVSKNIYRFMPARFLPEDMARYHGTNERISTKNYAEMVRFYSQLLRNASAPF